MAGSKKPVSAKGRNSATSEPQTAQEITEFLENSSNTNDNQVLRLCMSFLQRNPHHHDRNALEVFLGVDADPPREETTTILPLDELEERLMHIERVERAAEIAGTAPLTRYQFAGLLLMPIGNLRRFGVSFGLINYVKEVQPLVRIFLTKAVEGSTKMTTAPTSASRGSGTKATSASGGSGMGKRKASAASTSAKRIKASDENYNPRTPDGPAGELRRDKTVAEERKRVDNGRCVVLGTADPQACHIIPWSSCNNPVNLELFRSSLTASLLALVEANDINDPEIIRHFTGSVGASDKLWNVISLNPQMHVWWGKAYFGFKYLGILPSETDEESFVSVQFYWMPRAIPWQQDQRDQEEIGLYLTNDYSPFSSRGVAGLRLTGRPVISGDIFNIRVAAVDAQKMAMAFRIQWALIRIAAVTGAADVDTVGPGDDGLPPADGGLEEGVDVLAWLNDVRQGPPAGDIGDEAIPMALPDHLERSEAETPPPASPTLPKVTQTTLMPTMVALTSIEEVDTEDQENRLNQGL
ncbi:hypothetical protein QBC39DRAFT_337415 [Podospora conica]|nr:hypothetical protein QBC39DRAFT_337415 [Schizothecium conicum]